ncbi:MAG: bactofilin family protein [Parvibaculales bacterium]
MHKTTKAKFKSAPSILSHDMHITGQIVSSGDIQIEGMLDGDVRSHAVTIGENAVINGEVAGEIITVFGTIIGTIRARRVHLCASCNVKGDIYHQALAIESGAEFNGSVKREKDPLAQAAIAFSMEELEGEARPLLS